jgi:hypothetical protein
VFENRLLRRMFGPKTGEITEGRRKVQRFIICTPRPIIRAIKTWMMVGGTYDTHGK